MTTITSEQLRGMWGRGVYVAVSDATYALPTKRWLLAMAKEHAAKLGRWRKAFDCDDFAMSLKVETQKMHREADVDGLAVGVCFYRRDKGGAHAINWAVSRNGLYFIEPQTGREVWLSESELQSVYFVYV